MKETKTFHVAETATGTDETYTQWQEWLTIRERYAARDEKLCRAIRVFLAQGHPILVTSAPPPEA